MTQNGSYKSNQAFTYQVEAKANGHITHIDGLVQVTDTDLRKRRAEAR